MPVRLVNIGVKKAPVRHDDKDDGQSAAARLHHRAAVVLDIFSHRKNRGRPWQRKQCHLSPHQIHPLKKEKDEKDYAFALSSTMGAKSQRQTPRQRATSFVRVLSPYPPLADSYGGRCVRQRECRSLIQHAQPALNDRRARWRERLAL